MYLVIENLSSIPRRIGSWCAVFEFHLSLVLDIELRPNPLAKHNSNCQMLLPQVSDKTRIAIKPLPTNFLLSSSAVCQEQYCSHLTTVPGIRRMHVWAPCWEWKVICQRPFPASKYRSTLWRQTTIQQMIVWLFSYKYNLQSACISS